jgi:transposase
MVVILLPPVMDAPARPDSSNRSLDRSACRTNRRMATLAKSWLWHSEWFSWRRFRNRREVAGILGLTATPQASGDRRREQGIGKSGSALLRGLALELAWCWLRYQPRSELSNWFRRRFASGGSRQRRIGIVAVARRLMIALWRYVETGQVPAGAMLKA